MSTETTDSKDIKNINIKLYPSKIPKDADIVDFIETEDVPITWLFRAAVTFFMKSYNKTFNSVNPPLDYLQMPMQSIPMQQIPMNQMPMYQMPMQQIPMNQMPMNQMPMYPNVDYENYMSELNKAMAEASASESNGGVVTPPSNDDDGSTFPNKSPESPPSSEGRENPSVDDTDDINANQEPGTEEPSNDTKTSGNADNIGPTEAQKPKETTVPKTDKPVVKRSSKFSSSNNSENSNNPSENENEHGNPTDKNGIDKVRKLFSGRD